MLCQSHFQGIMQHIFYTGSHSHSTNVHSTWYPLRLGVQRWGGFRARPRLLHMTGTVWSNPRLLDLGSNALTTWPHAPHSSCYWYTTSMLSFHIPSWRWVTHLFFVYPKYVHNTHDEDCDRCKVSTMTLWCFAAFVFPIIKSAVWILICLWHCIFCDFYLFVRVRNESFHLLWLQHSVFEPYNAEAALCNLP